MAKMPEYFHFRVVVNAKGTEVELLDVSDHDFVEVVRCRDCKHYLPHEVDGTDGKCKRFNRLVVYDDYCSDADMREVTADG